jgi:hypothetical protein
METEEVFDLIHQNGIGKNITCFFCTNTLDGGGYMSEINNYKYHKGQIKISLNRVELQKHEKNLAKCPDCELLIKKEESKFAITVQIFCKFIEIESRFIFVRAFRLKYFDSEGLEINKKIPSN